MRILPALVALTLVLSSLFAVPLEMTEPLQKTLDNGDEVFIGTIGPGQTLEIRLDPIVTSGGIFGQGGVYDLAEVTEVPTGWSSTPSDMYGNPLQVRITAAKDAPEGEYTSLVTVVDEKNGEQLGNVTFRAKINVTWDVLDAEVSPSQITVGPGQPAQFAITVTNKGSASDQFVINASGVRRWEFVKPVYVPAKSSRTIYYEITGDEEEYYAPRIGIVSASSPLIHEEKNVSLTVRSDLLGDYMATSHGTLLFPVFEAPIYALSGLIGALAEAFMH